MTSFSIAKSAARRPRAGFQEPALNDRARRLSNTVLDLRDTGAYVAEIGKLWSEAQEKFVVIGRYLNQAKATLPHGEFEHMIATQLPFGRHVAFQLRSVAAAVDGGRLLEDELPHSYATAYKLAILEDRHLGLARERGLVRPAVTRREIEAFRREVADAASPDGVRGALTREWKAVCREVERLEEQLRHAHARRAQLEAEMHPGSVPTRSPGRSHGPVIDADGGTVPPVGKGRRST
jgi:hypothetical protein